FTTSSTRSATLPSSTSTLLPTLATQRTSVTIAERRVSSCATVLCRSFSSRRADTGAKKYHSRATRLAEACRTSGAVPTTLDRLPASPRLLEAFLKALVWEALAGCHKWAAASVTGGQQGHAARHGRVCRPTGMCCERERHTLCSRAAYGPISSFLSLFLSIGVLPGA